MIHLPRSPKIGYHVSVPPLDGSSALARLIAVHLLRALGVWLGVVVLASLAGIVRLADIRYAPTTGLLRFGMLFWRWLAAVLVGEALVLLAFQRGWLGDASSAACSRVLTTGFGIAAVFFGVLSAIALLNSSDPWEYLPGGPPFNLRDFAAKHPHLRIQTLGFGGSTVEVRNGSSPRVILSEWELRDAVLSWEESTDAAEQVRLGGPPPFPGSKCYARLRINRKNYLAMSDEEMDKDFDPPEVRTVMFVYSPGSVVYGHEVARHFLEWVRRVGPDPTAYGDYSRSMEVKAGGKTWSILILGARRSVHEIHVAQSETLPATPSKNK